MGQGWVCPKDHSVWREGEGGKGETAVVLTEKLTLEPTDLLEFSHCLPT